MPLKVGAEIAKTLTLLHSKVDGLTDTLNKLYRVVSKVLLEEDEIMSALTDLQTQVAQNASVESSAVLLIQGIAAALQAALSNNDTAALQALTTQLSASATSLAAAVTANTPAA